MAGPMKKHEPFIMNELIPSLFEHSSKVGCDSIETALAVFMSLGTILLEQGLTADSLMLAVRGGRVSTHDAPEGLQ